MELIAELVNNQFTSYIPVALVLVALTLLFTFGFKSAEQPPFDKLSAVADDRKTNTKKQRKVKEKKSSNGNSVPMSESKNEKAKLSPTKETPNTPKQTKKQEPNSPKALDKKKVEVKAKTVEEKNKKNLKQTVEKPVDFDEGHWETVPTKNDKKKKQDSPKKEKKPKSDVKETKVTKDEDNKENKVENIAKEEKVKQEEKIKQDEVKPEPIPEPVDKIEKSPDIKQAAFDELGDVWTDAKAAKKSKKKSRRDN